MKITLVAVGKIREKFFSDAVAEYEKRLSRYCKLEIIQVPDEKIPERASQAQENLVKKREGERVLAQIRDSSYVIALAIQGREMDSEGLAEKLAELGLAGNSDICFVIGGSLGLSDEVMRRSDEALSFSRLTFPHQLMRVILLEQIYRCFKINMGEPYHK
ncbi:MAG: 23S rRNA (pseudouridine(1915)-N(3))-methyltransferase RlmH [Clostridiales bacterium]|nr:23S rRNA (pseudouridine(1915)-N(3))-methyltransferase RlmH [Clostridiales bacterium]